jgi:hypothetical protein
MESPRWPDFIVIGAGKSGTTALNKYLDQHKGIFMALRKEPNFFGLEDVDPDSYELEESREYHLKSVYEKEEYLKLFEGATSSHKTGEISNLYMFSEEACSSIKKYAPNAKLIALLRQPADRLFSRYLHMVREETIPYDDWSSVFQKGTIWWKRPDLINEGFYYKHLKKYYDNFPHENIRVYLYDDFRSDPLAVLRDIFQFIGVDHEVAVDTDIVVNKSGKRKKNLFNVLLGQNGVMINMAKTIFPNLHRKMRRNKDAVKYLNKARNKNIVSMKMDPEIRDRITQDIYREDILGLSQLLDRDLSFWLDEKSISSTSAS